MDLLTANDKQGKYPASYYAEHATKLEKFPCLKNEIQADVCVVGGGFTGLSTALHLAQSGYKVALLEAQRLGFGASGRNGGQVSGGQRMDQEGLEAMLGDEHAKALWGISQQSVDLVRNLSADMDDCGVVDGIIHTAHRKRYVNEEHAYTDHLRNKYGYDKIRNLSCEETRDLINSPAYFGGTLDMGAGHIDPLRYALGLARKCVDLGVMLYEQSKVIDLKPGDPAKIKTEHGSVSAKFVVLACNGYLGRLNSRVAARVMPINNFIIATEPMSEEAQEALIKNNHAVADSKFVVNYFRFSPDRRLLFGGSESYGYKFPNDIAAAVRKPMLEIYPQLKNTRIDYAWGGTLGITMNRMPHFERIGGNILSASGYSGHGVAMATMGGKMAADAIRGQAEQFDFMASVPSPRFPGGAMLRSPLLVLAMLWFSMRDRL
ncbi:FAD-binding oxidoreductase [Amylibacter sp.]|nr:FAD-binding oxidoreductase [Amylibacter sp.]